MLYSVALLSLLPAALANIIRIDVGLGGLKFVPDNVAAAPGDVLEFHYHPKNHSVQQSSFAAPCAPLAGGFDSGFNPVASEEVAATTQHFSITVNNTKPIWIYCAQAAHCKSGMSMVVNQAPPPTKNTIDAYRAAAALLGNSTAGPVAPVGGVFSNGTATNSSSSVALTTYTSYSTYTTSSAGVATTVSTAQTVTALSSSSATSSSATSTSSTAVATGNAAAGPLDVASWAVAAGIVAMVF